MTLYEFIYINANKARIIETQATEVGKKIIAAYSTSKEQTSPNFIHKLGKSFNDYENELYTNAIGDSISQEQFVIELYKELLATEDLSEEQIFDGIFYYLLPADKKFIIPHNYQNIRYRVEDANRADKIKTFVLSRHFALELFLKDIIGAYNSNYDLLIKSNFEKTLLYVIKHNLILDSLDENDANLLKVLRKHY